MARPFTVCMALATAACADDVTGPSRLGEQDLVGSYVLTAYNASPLPTGLSGALNLKVDSSFTDAHKLNVDSSYTLSLSLSDAWANASSGKWSWTGANVLFTGAHSGHIFGSILNDGLGITAGGYPALYFRKH
jgi:hypothetical protein